MLRSTENPQTRKAKQLAVCFAEAVRPRAEGMIVRYEADYMPWSFGERVQAMGVVTLLVEAGGWPGPDPTPMVEVHFDGLVATLRAIADGRYAMPIRASTTGCRVQTSSICSTP